MCSMYMSSFSHTKISANNMHTAFAVCLTRNGIANPICDLYIYVLKFSHFYRRRKMYLYKKLVIETQFFLQIIQQSFEFANWRPANLEDFHGWKAMKEEKTLELNQKRFKEKLQYAITGKFQK